MMLVWFMKRVHLVNNVVITEYVQFQGGPLVLIWRIQRGTLIHAVNGPTR